jgi:hypothetical protein
MSAPICKTCGGTRIVDDGALRCSAGGIPFENGPINCVKDCPDCSTATNGERYTCIGKGGEYEVLGIPTGAGTLKQMGTTIVYRDVNTGQLFLRTALDFNTRMQRIERVIGFDLGEPGGDRTVQWSVEEVKAFSGTSTKLTFNRIDDKSLKLQSLLNSVADLKVTGVVCAASVGGVHCQAIRADGSLFCGQHRHADSRQKRAPLTNEALAFMMQRDGEQQ